MSVADVSPSEATLDAEVAARHRMIERRGHLDDLVVLHVQAQGAPDAAIPADGIDLRLPRLVPGARLPMVVLPLEHEGARRADGDAVAAVDARGTGQRDAQLRRDAGIEAAPGDGDGKRVLEIVA